MQNSFQNIQNWNANIKNRNFWQNVMPLTSKNILMPFKLQRDCWRRFVAFLFWDCDFCAKGVRKPNKFDVNNNWRQYIAILQRWCKKKKERESETKKEKVKQCIAILQPASPSRSWHSPWQTVRSAAPSCLSIWHRYRVNNLNKQNNFGGYKWKRLLYNDQHCDILWSWFNLKIVSLVCDFYF